MKKCCLLILYLLSVTCGFAQQQKVWLHGQVVNELDKKLVPRAQIASYKNMELFAADSLGQFKVILDSSDSIKIVALGYEALTVYLDTMGIDADVMYSFLLKPISYQIDQVNINSNKHYNDYLEELKALRSKQMEMDLQLPSHIQLGRQPDIPVDVLPTFRDGPIISDFIKKPFFVLYYYTAKSEKRKRKMVKLLTYEKQQKKLTRQLIEGVCGYKGDQLNDFIAYCNANIVVTTEDTAISLRYKILDLMVQFRKL
ncbi:hypothetical protein [Carboxylicivirga sp. RSCT41]|uniref:hypothetical protein n=1 Tax=Carboxylicivirga agarovorans TaxID=3417570 RepID=UPI003D33F4DA